MKRWHRALIGPMVTIFTISTMVVPFAEARSPRRGRARGRRARRPAVRRRTPPKRPSARRRGLSRPRPGRTGARAQRLPSEKEIQRKLMRELRTYRPDLNGERFHDIAKRLFNFYRKAGEARNFERAKETSQKDVQAMAKGVSESPAATETEARDEIPHQTAPRTVDTRSNREVLRRKVDQWTYGFEYQQLAGFLKSGKAPGRLKGDYRRAEADAVVAFWSDCPQIQAICEEPRTEREKVACMHCAEAAVKEHCLEGRKRDSRGRYRCRGELRKLVAYLGLGKSGNRRVGGMQKQTAKRLTKFLEEHKGCFQNTTRKKGLPRWWSRRTELDFQNLRKLATAGDEVSFGKLFEKTKAPSCYHCTLNGHNRWHTREEHCFEVVGFGPLYAGCIGGMLIGRWADDAFKNLFGGKKMTSAQVKLGTWEVHQLRLGAKALGTCRTKQCRERARNANAEVKKQYQALSQSLFQNQPDLAGRPHLQIAAVGDGRFTLYNWLALQIISDALDPAFHGGLGVTNRRLYVDDILRNVVERKFEPKEVDPQKGITNRGRQYLNSLPLTAWQRCYLWSPSTDPDFCDGSGGKMKSCREHKKGEPAYEHTDWRASRLFQIVLDHPDVKFYIQAAHRYWVAKCAQKNRTAQHFWFIPIPFTEREAPQYNCKVFKDIAKTNADKFFDREDPAKKGTNTMGAVGEAIGQAAGPIVGKLLGMLLKAAGMYGLMKTLAKAAGMTPEQSADCEDREYRRDVMHLPAAQDNKRGCLLRVFAKNFTSVLESIIVMVGNKLVDWGVDLLRGALQAVKSSLTVAAGSVPYVGGFLAMLIDIAWELIMNFGAKTVLKMFVVAKLPEWLQVRQLAKLPLEKVLENPVVQVIAGILLQVIDSAMVYGEKGWIEVGADTVLTSIRLALENPCGLAKGRASCKKKPEYFWIRALHYAQKKLRGSSAGEGDWKGQLLRVVKAMVGGFGEAVKRRLDGDARDQFGTAIEEVQDLLTVKKLEEIKDRLAKKPVAELTRLIAPKLGKIVVPVVTSFVNMPAWAKKMVNAIGIGVADTLAEITDSAKKVEPQAVVARLIKVVRPMLTHFVDRLPVDGALKAMLQKGLGAITGALENIDTLEKDLRDPWKIVEGVVGLTKDFLSAKVRDLIQGSRLGPERTLISGALDGILAVLTKRKLRERLFRTGTSPPDPTAILGHVAKVVQPYAVARLKALAAGTGLEGLVARAVDFFLGKQGPLHEGPAFVKHLKAQLRTRGPAIAATALDALAGIVTTQADRIGAGPVVGSLVQGLLGALKMAMRSRSGLAGVMKQGSAGVLKLAKRAFEPLMRTLVSLAEGASQGPLAPLVRNVLGGVLDVIGSPEKLAKLAQGVARGGPGALAQGLAVQARAQIKARVTGAIPNVALKALAGRAVDWLFDLVAKGPALASLEGSQIPGLLKTLAAQLFGFVQGQVRAVLPRRFPGAPGQMLQQILDAIVAELKGIAANPGRIRSLASGRAQDVVAWVAGALEKPARALIARAAPAPLRAALGSALSGALRWLAKPAGLNGLVKIKAGSLLGRVAPTIQRLLREILGQYTPADLRKQLGSVLAKVKAALASPGKLAGQAGAAARRALDAAIDTALARIPDAGLQGLARDLVALVRDLTGDGAIGAELRRNSQELLRRLVATGSRYVLGLIPAGAIRDLVGRAIRGLRRLLEDPAGIARALARKARSLWTAARDGVLGLLRSMLEEAIPDSRLAALATGLLDGVVGLMTNPPRGKLTPSRVMGLLAQMLPIAGGALSGLAAKVAEGLRAPVRSLVAGPIPDPDLKTMVGGAIDWFFDLLANPSKIAALKGAKVVAVLKGIGTKLLGFLRAKAQAALVKRGAQGKIPQRLLDAIAGQLQALIADPGQIRSLVGGSAKEVIALVAKAFAKEAGALAEQSVPAPLRGAIGGALTQALRWLSNPSGLSSLPTMKVDRLLKGIGPVVHGVLHGILAQAVPAALRDKLTAALGQVKAALANPAGLAAKAGAAVRKAIDTVIAAALMRIGDGGLRNLAADLVALLRDLAAAGPQGQKLRGSVPAILERLVAAGARYVTTLVPSGPMRQLVSQALGGLRSVVADRGGLARSLAQKAEVLLPGVKDALVGLLRSTLREVLPDPRLATLATGLFDQVVGLVTHPQRWQELQRSGVGYLLHRLIPVGRELAVSMLGAGGADPHLRAVVEGVVRAATRLLSNPKALPGFAKNAVSTLVSMGLGALTPVVLGLVRQATGSRAVGDFVRRALDELAAILAKPDRLRKFLKLTAPRAFQKLLGEARGLVEALIRSVVKDRTLQRFAREGLGGVLAFVQKASGAGGAEAAVKELLETMIESVAAILREKLVAFLPDHQKALKALVTTGFDKLVSFASDLVTRGEAAWRELTAGGSILGKMVQAVLPMVKEPILRTVRIKPVRTLLTGLIDMVGELLHDPAKLVRDFRSAGAGTLTGLELLLPKLAKPLEAFLREAIVAKVPPGIPRTVVEAIVGAGVGFLQKPQRLMAFLKDLRSPQKLLQRVMKGLAEPLLDPIRKQGNRALANVLEEGLKFLADNLLGSAGRR